LPCKEVQDQNLFQTGKVGTSAIPWAYLRLWHIPTLN